VTTPDDEATRALQAIRDEIERVDREIVALVARRLELARRTGDVKRAHNLPLFDAAREAAVVRRAAELSREAGLPEEEARNLFWILIGMARRLQAEEAP
jgi:monofunctional chorismate mutase